MEVVRAFIAVEVPPAEKENMQTFLIGLARRFPDIPWTTVDHLHFTLAFLGDVSENRLSDIKIVCDDVAKEQDCFGLRLGNLGFFPSGQRPKVVWLGVDQGGEAMIKLQAGVKARLERVGFELENRPFVPHMTLARIQKTGSQDGSELRDRAETIPPLGTDIWVEKISLMQSRLLPKKAVYTPLHHSRLKTDGSSRAIDAKPRFFE